MIADIAKQIASTKDLFSGSAATGMSPDALATMKHGTLASIKTKIKGLTCLDVNMAGILNQAICDSGFTAEQKAELGTDVATCMVDSV